MTEISPQIESGQIPERQESKGIVRRGVDRAKKALHVLNRHSQQPFIEELAAMRQSRSEPPAHGQAPKSDTSKVEEKEESPFPGAEKHVFPRPDTDYPFEYFTQSLDHTPSDGWKNLLGSDARVVAVIGDNNTLAWAHSMQNGELVMHGNILYLLGKYDIALTNKFTSITFTPSDRKMRIINFEGPGIDAVRPILNYFSSGFGDSADKIRVDYSGKDSDGHDEDFMRPLNELGGSNAENIRGRSELFDAYKTFAPEVARLKAELAINPDINKLGEGNDSTAHVINKDGKDYVVRLLKNPEKVPILIDRYTAGAILGKGIPHLEQFAAVDYEEGVTISEVMPGKESNKLTAEEIETITDEQLGQLIDTIRNACGKGIKIDRVADNIFYDSEEGFGVIDYYKSPEQQVTSQEIGSIAAIVIPKFGADHLSGLDPREEEYYTQHARFDTLSLNLLTRYRNIVNAKLNGDEARVATQSLDERIHSLEENVKNYTEPQWVTRQMKTHTARNRVEEVPDDDYL